ncbi:MAG: alanine--tRNA ligase-related protein [bacterium]|nr:alanine--tRNA ligase-related protein [bacterium]
MTKTRFHEDPYCWQFMAEVIKTGDNFIVLNETYFYPEGGGQTGDQGQIGPDKILNTKEVDGEVKHFTESTSSVSAGQEVNCELDWNTRFNTMRLHSLAHMIYLAFLAVAGKAKVIGSTATKEKCRVDLAYFGEINLERITEIVRKMIQDGLEIKTWEDDKKPGFRWWQIKGYQPIPCGGTHIRNTTEIGQFALSLKSLGKQGIRLYGTLD